MTLYDLNVENYAALPTMRYKDLQVAKRTIEDYLEENPAKYYLVLEKRQRYYTMLTYVGDERDIGTMADQLIDLAASLGRIKSIENGRGMIEMWIVDDENNCSMYGFFPWDEGVIEVT